jgi:uncharacterized protein (TIGR03067 family)
MPSSDDDVAALQGDWVQIALEVDGVVDPPDPHGPNGVITRFVGHEFFVYQAGDLILAGAFTLDAPTNAITWIDSMGPDAGKQLPALYQLEGDHFVFIAGDEGSPRPTRFETSVGQTMRTMRRLTG